MLRQGKLEAFLYEGKWRQHRNQNIVRLIWTFSREGNGMNKYVPKETDVFLLLPLLILS